MVFTIQNDELIALLLKPSEKVSPITGGINRSNIPARIINDRYFRESLPMKGHTGLINLRI